MMSFVPPAQAMDTTMIPLPGQTRQRLLELHCAFEGAQAVVTAAIETAQRIADRYNDALGAVKDALGVAPDAALDVDFVGGFLLVQTPVVDAETEPEAEVGGDG